MMMRKNLLSVASRQRLAVVATQSNGWFRSLSTTAASTIRRRYGHSTTPAYYYNALKSLSYSSTLQRARCCYYQQEQHRCCMGTLTDKAYDNDDDDDATTSQPPSAPSQDRPHTIATVRIVYATTGGTAQLFAMQLAEALQQPESSQVVVNDIQVQSIAEYPTVQHLLLGWDDTEKRSSSTVDDGAVLYLFLLSTTGVGEPTASAKPFYKDLMSMERLALDDNNHEDINHDNDKLPSIRYAIFGLGNKVAHPNHYNVIGKQVEAKFQQLSSSTSSQFQAALPLTLGDDGDCIDDDFDKWQDQVVDYITTRNREQKPKQSENEEPLQEKKSKDEGATAATTTKDATSATHVEDNGQERNLWECPGARWGKRLASGKYPFLRLELPSEHDTTRQQHPHHHYDLLDSHPEWYHNSSVEDSETKVCRFQVLNRRNLNPNGAANGLCEMELSLSHLGPHEAAYTTGDHFVVFPRNADFLVESYEQQLLCELNPQAIVSTTQAPCVNESPLCYRYPKGISLHDTLSFCVDLSAVPSPQFVRQIVNSNPHNNSKAKIDDYKEQVASCRRTALDLVLEYEAAPYLALEDYLYNLPPLLPRYYSIASSPYTIETKQSLLLTYRPVRYMTSQGHMREGVCTSFMNHLTDGSTIVGQIRHNPGFRLPEDPQVPIAMIAGGCGVAPIRSMLEERLVMVQRHEKTAQDYGKSILFLGFRDPDDVAYRELIQDCLSAGSLGEAYVSTDASPVTAQQTDGNDISWHCGNVTTGIQAHGQALWQNFEQGGHTYVCGGARNFGAAVGAQVVEVIQKYGNMSSVEDATAYLRTMIADGRFQEDLAN